MKPLMLSPGATVATDEQLVEAARDGSDVAFEALVRRYRERITAYVRGVVHDGPRTEDIVQETFISALRSLRGTRQEIAFRPWVFQIARNACIDHLRKVRRTDEISIDSEDFRSDFELRLSGLQSTDAAVLQRQDLDDLQQAFGGLPASQYEILLLREFEGLSYQEIGRRMELTPAAVESMLARARRSLKGQFDEITTGERCRRMRPVMTAVATGIAGKRDQRTLESHLRHCRYCRQDAVASGLEQLVVGGRDSRVKRALSRAAAMFPLPWLLRRHPPEGAPDPATSAGLSAGAQIHISHIAQITALGPAAAEQTASALQKAVAVVAVATVASGGGIVAKEAGVGVPLPNVTGGEKSAPAKERPDLKLTGRPAPQSPAAPSAPAGSGSGADEAPASAAEAPTALPPLAPTSEGEASPAAGSEPIHEASPEGGTAHPDVTDPPAASEGGGSTDGTTPSGEGESDPPLDLDPIVGEDGAFDLIDPGLGDLVEGSSLDQSSSVDPLTLPPVPDPQPESPVVQEAVAA